jgi:hypothetical protein
MQLKVIKITFTNFIIQEMFAEALKVDNKPDMDCPGKDSESTRWETGSLWQAIATRTTADQSLWSCAADDCRCLRYDTVYSELSALCHRL